MDYSKTLSQYCSNCFFLSNEFCKANKKDSIANEKEHANHSIEDGREKHYGEYRMVF